ncbi:MAG: hypothetical protein DRJ40_01050 [Thermoprotei archaeon]|mgnify:CR=1 FL=1|nr:MAG: hypothetical protein DRJ40_01050 [Thermoprotei archaeon]
MSLVLDASAFKILAKQRNLYDLCRMLSELSRRDGRRYMILVPNSLLKLYERLVPRLRFEPRILKRSIPLAIPEAQQYRSNRLFQQLLRDLTEFFRSEKHTGAEEDAEWLATALMYHIEYIKDGDFLVITHGEYEYRRFASAKN